MPRMLVNLAPSTVQFNDGESPIVSGLAHFGETMAKLPMQQAQIRMQQQQQQDERDQFAASNQLRMSGDAREQQVHELSMQVGHGKAIEGGYVLPEPANDQMLTAPEQNDLLLQQRGNEERAAALEATHHKHEGHYAGFIPRGRDPFKMNTATGEVEEMFPPTPEDAMAAQVARDNQIAADRQSTNDSAQHGFFRGLNPSYWMHRGENAVPEAPSSLPRMGGGAPQPVQASMAPPQQAPAMQAAPQQHSPDDVEFHAHSIHNLIQQGDRAGAQAWAAHMRADYGDDFANAVRARIGATSSPQGP